MVESTASASASGCGPAFTDWVHSNARVARVACDGCISGRTATTHGGHNFSWILRKNGLYSLHGDVKSDALDVDATFENGPAMDVEPKIHH